MRGLFICCVIFGVLFEMLHVSCSHIVQSTLEENGVEQECILNLTVRLLGGGGKKKKKKVYTKPKKNKHKKKKTPLAVLKFYKVDDDGTITRTRIECPHPGHRELFI